MFKFYGKSTKSYLKEINQDCLLVNNIVSNNEHIKGSSKNENILFAIADGVGGSKYGEIASNYILEELAKNRNLLNHQLIINTIRNVHHDLIKQYSYSAQTVLSIIWIEKEKFTIYHIGDTRVYLITERNLIQLTNDHTYVQELVDKGIISNIMKLKHPKKNIITQSLGINYHFLFNKGPRSFFIIERVVLYESYIFKKFLIFSLIPISFNCLMNLYALSANSS